MQSINITNAQHMLSMLNGGVQFEIVMHSYVSWELGCPPLSILREAFRCLFPKGAANKQEV